MKSSVMQSLSNASISVVTAHQITRHLSAHSRCEAFLHWPARCLEAYWALVEHRQESLGDPTIQHRIVRNQEEKEQ